MLGFCLRISCRTPLLGPFVGLLGVGFASALAGQASTHTRKFFTKVGRHVCHHAQQPQQQQLLH
jgi:hypothetical protein